MLNSRSYNKSNKMPASTDKKKMIIIIVGIIFLFILVYVIYKAYKTATEKNKNSPIIVSTPIDAYKSRAGISVPISTEGLTLSVSTWIYVDDWNYNYGNYKNIIWRGNLTTDSSGNITSDTSTRHSPSISLYPLSPNLKITTSTTNSDGLENCDINNIPLKTWVNIVYILNNRTVDVYINGKLEKSCVLKGVPQLVDSDLFYITTGNPNPGYYGQIGRTQYFTSALTPKEVSNIYQYGPNGTTRYKVQFFQDGKFIKINDDSGYST